MKRSHSIKQSVSFTKVTLIVKHDVCYNVDSAVFLNYVSIKTTHPSLTLDLNTTTLLTVVSVMVIGKPVGQNVSNPFWLGVLMQKVTSQPGNML